MNRVLVDTTGTTRYYQGENLHREDGPAIETGYGDKIWCISGKLHCTNGPAIIRRDGSKEWWINGFEYDALEWLIEIHKLQRGS